MPDSTSSSTGIDHPSETENNDEFTEFKTTYFLLTFGIVCIIFIIYFIFLIRDICKLSNKHRRPDIESNVRTEQSSPPTSHSENQKIILASKFPPRSPSRRHSWPPTFFPKINFSKANMRKPPKLPTAKSLKEEEETTDNNVESQQNESKRSFGCPNTTKPASRERSNSWPRYFPQKPYYQRMLEYPKLQNQTSLSTESKSLKKNNTKKF